MSAKRNRLAVALYLLAIPVEPYRSRVFCSPAVRILLGAFCMSPT